MKRIKTISTRVPLVFVWIAALAFGCSGGGDDDDGCGECQVLVDGECRRDPTCNSCEGEVPECLPCQTFNPDECVCDGPEVCVCELECASCQIATETENGCECVMKPDSTCGDGFIDFGEKCDPPGSPVENGGCGTCCDRFICEGDCFSYNGSRCAHDSSDPACVVCGNGIKEGEECCDDGNGSACDGCTAGCSCESPQGNCPCPIDACGENQLLINPENDLCACVDKPCGGLECSDPAPYLDEESCLCVDSLCDLECAGLKVPNPLCTKCVCPSVECPFVTLRDPDTCECVASSCTDPDPCQPPFVRMADCRCACDPFQVECANPYLVDERSCTCGCALFCGSNERVDTAACECVPTKCGNGIVEGSEVCDGGADNGRGPGYCDTRCEGIVVCAPSTGFTVDVGGLDYLPDCPQ